MCSLHKERTAKQIARMKCWLMKPPHSPERLKKGCWLPQPLVIATALTKPLIQSSTGCLSKDRQGLRPNAQLSEHNHGAQFRIMATTNQGPPLLGRSHRMPHSQRTGARTARRVGYLHICCCLPCNTGTSTFSVVVVFSGCRCLLPGTSGLQAPHSLLCSLPVGPQYDPVYSRISRSCSLRAGVVKPKL